MSADDSLRSERTTTASAGRVAVRAVEVTLLCAATRAAEAALVTDTVVRFARTITTTSRITTTLERTTFNSEEYLLTYNIGRRCS